MIERLVDLWAVGDTADAICLTTNGTIKSNGRGVMGRGVALQATQRWRHLPSLLGQHLAQHGNHVGPLTTICRTPGERNGQPTMIALLAFPVKHEWQQRADPVLIVQSCRELIALTDR